jgi:hypothetical protein
MPNTPSGTRIWPTLMPLGRCARRDLADRVGHGGDLLAAFGHGGDDLVSEPKAVDQRGGQAGRLGCGDVFLVRLGQRRRFMAQQASQRHQGEVLRGRRRCGHLRAGGTGGGAHVGDGGLQFEGSHPALSQSRWTCGTSAPSSAFVANLP